MGEGCNGLAKQLARLVCNPQANFQPPGQRGSDLTEMLSFFLWVLPWDLGNEAAWGRGRREAGLGYSGLCPRSRKHGHQVPAHNSGVLWKQALPPQYIVVKAPSKVIQTTS